MVKQLEKNHTLRKFGHAFLTPGLGNMASRLILRNNDEVREKALLEHKCELNIEYGKGKNTKVDIYYPKHASSDVKDVLIFVHGGFWQKSSKDVYAFMASHLNSLDCILVMVEYDLAPHETIDGIVNEVERAVTFIGEKFPLSRLFLCGHSAGAHLCAMMMTIDWDNRGIPRPQRFSGVCLLSGIYDLEPVVSTYVNEQLKMSKETAVRNSPLRIAQSKVLTIQCSVLVAVAAYDSPPFIEQSKDFYTLLKEKLPHDVELLEVPDVDHFDIMERFVEEDYILNKKLIHLMKNQNKNLHDN